MRRAAAAPSASRRKLYLGLWLGWAALTFALTSIPNPRLQTPLLVTDKVAHLAFYAVMAFFFALWRRESGASAVRAVVLALLFAALAGAADEVHQYWIPGRNADPLDWLADTAGGGCGAVFSVVLSWQFPFLVTE